MTCQRAGGEPTLVPESSADTVGERAGLLDPTPERAAHKPYGPRSRRPARPLFSGGGHAPAPVPDPALMDSASYCRCAVLAADIMSNHTAK